MKFLLHLLIFFFKNHCKVFIFINLWIICCTSSQSRTSLCRLVLQESLLTPLCHFDVPFVISGKYLQKCVVTRGYWLPSNGMLPRDFYYSHASPESLRGGGFVFEHKSPVSPARARWCICLGLDGCFFLSFSRTKEDCYSSLLSQSLGRSDLAAILAGLQRVLEVFYIPATFEECNSDFLLQPWPPSYSIVWATSASSKYLRNLSLIK